MTHDAMHDAARGDQAPRITFSRSGADRRWQVGADRVELAPDGDGWVARVQRAGWGGAALDVDRHFRGEDEAVAWCGRMAAVLDEDLEDERSTLLGRDSDRPHVGDVERN